MVVPLLIDHLGNLVILNIVHDLRCIGAQVAIAPVNFDGKSDAGGVLEVQRRCMDERILVCGGGRHSNVLMLSSPMS